MKVLMIRNRIKRHTTHICFGNETIDFKISQLASIPDMEFDNQSAILTIGPKTYPLGNDEVVEIYEDDKKIKSVFPDLSLLSVGMMLKELTDHAISVLKDPTQYVSDKGIVIIGDICFNFEHVIDPTHKGVWYSLNCGKADAIIDKILGYSNNNPEPHYFLSREKEKQTPCIIFEINDVVYKPSLPNRKLGSVLGYSSNANQLFGLTRNGKGVIAFANFLPNLKVLLKPKHRDTAEPTGNFVFFGVHCGEEYFPAFDVSYKNGIVHFNVKGGNDLQMSYAFDPVTADFTWKIANNEVFPQISGVDLDFEYYV